MKNRKGLFTFLDSDGSTNFQLYNTVIVTTRPDGVRLNSGGFKTNHTKNCINDIINPLGIRLYQKNFEWFIEYLDTKKVVEFNDGMLI